MTVLGTRPSLRPGAQVLGDHDVPEALRLCAADPVASVLASARLIPAARAGLARTANQLWGYAEDGQLLAACLVSANLVPIAPGLDLATRARAMAAFATLAVQRRRAYSSLVGPTELVMDLWQRMSEEGRLVARDVRPEQPSMVIDRPPLVGPDPMVRRSRTDEFDIVLPACVNMFTEEVGYSPMTGGGVGYTSRVRTLVAQGRSFVRVEADRGRPRVIFKAELAVSGFGVSQIQGVWVTPDRRGAGLSEPGMAAVVEQGRSTADPVISLYVNSYNTRAIAAYRAVGFRQVGTYATIQL
ncbi:MAG: GNAT family N-acetyltransferase [Cellulomonas sp.]|jgi:predicted GNAT family acetyltransferase|nr:GNAT family N-acetyltransferase [Cellulomonas sp.]